MKRERGGERDEKSFTSSPVSVSGVKRACAAMSAGGRTDMGGFELERVVNDNPTAKTLTVLGTFAGSSGRALVTLKRPAFDVAELGGLLGADSALEETFANDVYATYSLRPPADLAFTGVVADVVCPCTDAHVSKAERQEVAVVRETPEVYAKVTLPFIEAFPPERLQWVRNILDKTAEADRMIFEDANPDTGFVLHPDMKWDGVTAATLYCVAIVHNARLRSLRDLRGGADGHADMLEALRAKVIDAVGAKYGVPASSLRMYLHYQPSYYHLHVHVTHVQFDAGGQQAGRAHLLEDVIDCLRRDPQGYARATLTYVLGTKTPLYAAMLDAGVVVVE